MQKDYLKFGVILVLAASGLVLADGEPQETKPKPLLCSEVKSLAEFRQCLSQTAQETDSKLNKTVIELNTLLSEVEADNSLAKGYLTSKLKDSQYAWEDLKKRNCDFYAKLALSKEHGALAYSACEIRMQEERLQELEVESDFLKEQKELSRKDSIYV
jgi:uncharacterized protein YecT (DUF1311 family)